MALAVRRRLLCQPAEEVAEKTIIYENFDPNGASFINETTFDKSLYDLRSNATFFADIELATVPSETKYIISIGGNDISTADGRANGYPRTVIHIYYDGGYKMRGAYRAVSTTSATSRVLTITNRVINNHIKFALNEGTLAINGIIVGDVNNWYNAHKEIIAQIYRNGGAVKVGVKFGTPPATAHYNEVSIIHGFLSADEMIEITS